MGKGLLQQIEEQASRPYKTLTKTVFEGFLEDLKSQDRKREHTMFTGLGGMISYEMSFTYGGTFNYVHFCIYKRISGYFFSIGKKHGPYKVYAKNGSLELRRSTETIFRCRTVKELKNYIFLRKININI